MPAGSISTASQEYQRHLENIQGITSMYSSHDPNAKANEQEAPENAVNTDRKPSEIHPGMCPSDSIAHLSPEPFPPAHIDDEGRAGSACDAVNTDRKPSEIHARMCPSNSIAHHLKCPPGRWLSKDIALCPWTLCYGVYVTSGGCLELWSYEGKVPVRRL